MSNKLFKTNRSDHAFRINYDGVKHPNSKRVHHTVGKDGIRVNREKEEKSKDKKKRDVDADETVNNETIIDKKDVPNAYLGQRIMFFKCLSLAAKLDNEVKETAMALYSSLCAHDAENIHETLNFGLSGKSKNLYNCDYNYYPVLLTGKGRAMLLKNGVDIPNDGELLLRKEHTTFLPNWFNQLRAPSSFEEHDRMLIIVARSNQDRCNSNEFKPNFKCPPMTFIHDVLVHDEPDFNKTVLILTALLLLLHSAADECDSDMLAVDVFNQFKDCNINERPKIKFPLDIRRVFVRESAFLAATDDYVYVKSAIPFNFFDKLEENDTLPFRVNRMGLLIRTNRLRSLADPSRFAALLLNAYDMGLVSTHLRTMGVYNLGFMARVELITRYWKLSGVKSVVSALNDATDVMSDFKTTVIDPGVTSYQDVNLCFDRGTYYYADGVPLQVHNDIVCKNTSLSLWYSPTRKAEIFAKLVELMPINADFLCAVEMFCQENNYPPGFCVVIRLGQCFGMTSSDMMYSVAAKPDISCNDIPVDSQPAIAYDENIALMTPGVRSKTLLMLFCKQIAYRVSQSSLLDSTGRLNVSRIITEASQKSMVARSAGVSNFSLKLNKTQVRAEGIRIVKDVNIRLNSKAMRISCDVNFDAIAEILTPISYDQLDAMGQRDVCLKASRIINVCTLKAQIAMLPLYLAMVEWQRHVDCNLIPNVPNIQPSTFITSAHNSDSMSVMLPGYLAICWATVHNESVGPNDRIHVVASDFSNMDLRSGPVAIQLFNALISTKAGPLVHFNADGTITGVLDAASSRTIYLTQLCGLGLRRTFTGGYELSSGKVPVSLEKQKLKSGGRTFILSPCEYVSRCIMRLDYPINASGSYVTSNHNNVATLSVLLSIFYGTYTLVCVLICGDDAILVVRGDATLQHVRDTINEASAGIGQKCKADDMTPGLLTFLQMFFIGCRLYRRRTVSWISERPVPQGLKVATTLRELYSTMYDNIIRSCGATHRIIELQYYIMSNMVSKSGGVNKYHDLGFMLHNMRIIGVLNITPCVMFICSPELELIAPDWFSLLHTPYESIPRDTERYKPVEEALIGRKPDPAMIPKMKHNGVEISDPVAAIQTNAKKRINEDLRINELEALDNKQVYHAIASEDLWDARISEQPLTATREMFRQAFCDLKKTDGEDWARENIQMTEMFNAHSKLRTLSLSYHVVGFYTYTVHNGSVGIKCQVDGVDHSWNMPPVYFGNIIDPVAVVLAMWGYSKTPERLRPLFTSPNDSITEASLIELVVNLSAKYTLPVVTGVLRVLGFTPDNARRVVDLLTAPHLIDLLYLSNDCTLGGFEPLSNINLATTRFFKLSRCEYISTNSELNSWVDCLCHSHALSANLTLASMMLMDHCLDGKKKVVPIIRTTFRFK